MLFDFELYEANIEEIDISDLAADYDQNDFYEINELENQEESKMDIDKPFEDVSEFEQKQRQIFIKLFKFGKYLNASSSINLEKNKFSITKILNVFEYRIRCCLVPTKRQSLCQTQNGLDIDDFYFY